MFKQDQMSNGWLQDSGLAGNFEHITLDSDVLRMRGHAPFPHMHKKGISSTRPSTLDSRLWRTAHARPCVTLFLLAKKFPDFQPKMSHAQSGRDDGRGTWQFEFLITTYTFCSAKEERTCQGNLFWPNGPTTLKMSISVLRVNAYCYGKYPRYLPITGTEKWLTHSSQKKIQTSSQRWWLAMISIQDDKIGATT